MDEIQDGKTEPTPAAVPILFFILLSQEGAGGQTIQRRAVQIGYWAGISSTGNPGSTCP